MRYWNLLARGEGRDLNILDTHIKMHRDVPDVGYGALWDSTSVKDNRVCDGVAVSGTQNTGYSRLL